MSKMRTVDWGEIKWGEMQTEGKNADCRLFN